MLNNTIRDSFLASKKLKNIVLTSLIIAMYFVLEQFKVFVTPNLKLTFGFLAISAIASLFGPVMGGYSSIICEVLGFFIGPKTGSYFPGFTISAFISSIIYGFILYKPKITILNSFVAKGIVNLLVNVVLNTYWLSLLTGSAFLVLLPIRFIKNLILWPIEATLMFAVCSYAKRIHSSK